ncbi:MAG: PEP-CTERM sorting domain-containing protein [Verrucomicrobiae bacterium]|nr:PEP-CTERM sorting domain-containing protein [Verrucomicrobiae bacterium]
MKKTLIAAIAAVAIGTVAYGQGLVQFNNSGTTLVNVDLGEGLVPAAANSGFVQLLWAPVGTTDLSLFQPTLNAASGNITADGAARFISAGRFSGGTITIPGIAPGGATALVVRGWLGTAATWDEALAQGAATGWSAIFTMSETGNPTTVPAGTPIATSGSFPAGMVIAIPEPTSMALAGLGAAALLIFRRRK